MAWKRARLALIAVAVSLVLLFGLTLAPTQPKSDGEGIPVGGVAQMKVYNSQGELVGQWQGHNSLFSMSAAAISDCLSGVASNPPGFIGCGGGVDLMWITWASSGAHYYDLEGTTSPGVWSTPQPCATLCPEWEVSANFDSFTASNCGGSCSISTVSAGEACSSFFSYSAASAITQSTSTCYGQGGGFSAGSTCQTDYEYNSNDEMVQSNQAAACTSAKGPPAFTLGEAGIATPGTTLTLCDSVGNCGESLTTNAAGSTVASQFVGFDTLSPSLTIQPGDTLSISILYTVS